ncbi:probable small nuclear ribonucleoprotein G [Sycon ciliatum]|uniref:probable small nuclear ribonucleoprotein G n=1 Tax=Sycon ciliatum TaxID=27933 RepID=UPI0020AA0375
MSGKAHPPELKKYMDKRISLRLNGQRAVSGVLRGFDPFMNLVIDDAFDEVSPKERHSIGMVVVRGNSIVMLEALERINNAS